VTVPRVALVTPFAHPSVRGNAITVERIARSLRGHGVALRVWDRSALPEATLEEEVAEFKPTLVHAFHGFRVGPLALRVARQLGVPLVVTTTGTDANHDLFDPERAATVRSVLEGASAITVFHKSMARRVLQALPSLSDRLIVVPQSVSFEADGGGPVSPSSTPAPTGFRLLFPAGIRAVKNPLFPLRPLDVVAPRHPGLTLLYVGPVLDPEAGETLAAALRTRPWARHLGARPHREMRALIASADVVLNCSLSEGGMANSVLEALVLGRAVLASNIEGNRSLVEDGLTGLLFDTPEEFAEQLERLLGDPALRRRLGETARERVAARFTPARERDGYLDVYARAAAAPHRA